MKEKKKNKKILIGVILAIILILSAPAINIVNAEIIQNEKNNFLISEEDIEIKNQGFFIIKNTFLKNNSKLETMDIIIVELARMLLAAVLIPISIILSLVVGLLTIIPLISVLMFSMLKEIIIGEYAYFLTAICVLPFLISSIPLNTLRIILINKGKITFLNAFIISSEEMINIFYSIANGDY